MNLESFFKKINKLKNPKKAEILQRYFKTGKGEYGEGDVFLGLTSAQSKQLAKKYGDFSFNEIQELINSEVHEHRFISLLILIERFRKFPEKVFEFYLKNTKRINNWDLVDISAHKIVGAFLYNGDKEILFKLAKSENLWEKRISIVSTFYFIRQNRFDEALKISEILLNDEHDLIHKAVGWMLREIGKRDLEVEEDFLRKHYKKMPRTMLRYAIEKFDEEKRSSYLKGLI